MHAVLTRSTPGTRALLHKEAVGYTAPLATTTIGGTTSGRGGGGKGRKAPDKALHHPAAVHISEAALGGTRGALVFEGALRVHGLFELLLNRGPSLQDDAVDVPLLMAPVQFTHSALRSYTLEALGSSRPGRVPSFAPAPSPRTRHSGVGV